MKKTAQEILDVLAANNVDWSDFAYGEFNSEALGLGDFNIVEKHGGEGEGENYHVVQYFKDHDVYIRIDGFYQSYDGTYFDNAPYEVRPTERVVTFYEKYK
jgi:hypothetical protein